MSVSMDLSGHWNRVIALLIARGGLPKSANAMLCPDQDQAEDFIPKLLQEGALPELLTGVLSEVLEIPVYSEDQHGKPDQSGTNWVYASRILFLADPFWSGQMHPEQLIGETQVQLMQSFGLLHIQMEDAVQGSEAVALSEEMVMGWIKDAADNGISDLRFEPHNDQSARLYISKDGLQQVQLEYPLIPSDGRPPFALLANTILRLAGHPAGVWLVPLDGKIHIQNGRRINVRVSMRPVDVMGQTLPSIVARILGSGLALKPLDQLGLPVIDLEGTRNLLKRRQGLFIITGPTGSGKTTFLYSGIQHIQDHYPGRSIQTLEDPVEVFIPGITQTEINEKAGMTWHAGLRSLLRHDLDVALIGEIRDEETARLAISIAMTGHLVLATLHTNSALSAIDRMLDLGVSPHQLASNLSATYAQRLVRTVCPHCSKRIPFASNTEWAQRYQELFMPTGEDNFRIANPDGCDHCDKGYTGRQAICELALNDPATADLIASGAPLQAIEELKKDAGSRTLWHHAIEQCRSGNTTIDECEDVLGPRTNFHRVYRPALERSVS